MREREEYNTTTNNSVYKKLHKHLLEADGKIRCSWCGFHRGENNKNKSYGTIFRRPFDAGWETTLRHPSWKLASKNRKQWMDSGKEFVHSFTRNGHEWIDIKFE